MFTDADRIPTDTVSKALVLVAGLSLIFVVGGAAMGLSAYANLLTKLGVDAQLITGTPRKLQPADLSDGIRTYARLVIISLSVAWLSLTIFAAWRLLWGSTSVEPTTKASVTTSPTPIQSPGSHQAPAGIAGPRVSATYIEFWAEALGCVGGPFAPGEWHDPHIPANRGSELPCHWIDVRTVPTQLKRLRRSPPTLLLFIGSADKTRMRGARSGYFGSNQALARARANWVSEEILNPTNFSSTSMPKSLILTVGPAEHGRKLSTQQMEKDRGVAVFAFWLPELR